MLMVQCYYDNYGYGDDSNGYDDMMMRDCNAVMMLFMFESFVLFKWGVVFMSNYHMCADDTYSIILYCDEAVTYIHVCMLGHSYILYISCIK